MTKSAILRIAPLGNPPWETLDPFLFCVHHDDAYPVGNAQLGPAATLRGRNIGSDFAGLDGWRMYHGDVVPGFPQHPHRGFETITVVRSGYVDHSDSLGATARYGNGDVQWMTAGKGIVHAEMFPLVDDSGPNPLELFQIWMNLPKKHKMVDPHFSMLWADSIPRVSVVTARELPPVEVAIIAGGLQGTSGPQPPPKSWAADARADVAIWTLRMAEGARWTIPAAPSGVNRRLYFFRGDALEVEGAELTGPHSIDVAPGQDVTLVAGETECELLMLQGRPIGEPVVHYGPFVMNTKAEINQAMSDYRATGFGGWPWKRADPVHTQKAGRFAKHADGKIERAG